jgi:hypothetical protein
MLGSFSELMNLISFYYMVDAIDTLAGLIFIGVFLILRNRKTTDTGVRITTQGNIRKDTP